MGMLKEMSPPLPQWPAGQWTLTPPSKKSSSRHSLLMVLLADSVKQPKLWTNARPFSASWPRTATSQCRKLVTALCMEHGIPLIKVDSNMKLGEWAGLCKIDQEGKARKVVKCSACVVRDWGKESPAHDVLQEYLKANK